MRNFIDALIFATLDDWMKLAVLVAIAALGFCGVVS